MIKGSLNLFSIKSGGELPEPSNFFNITYSGGIVWTQGTIGDSVIIILGSDAPNQKPVDPKYGTEFSYSKLASRGGSIYQISSIFESNDRTAAMIPSYGIDTVYAASTENAYIIGNYHGRILQVQSGATNTILAMPSITLRATGALDISTGSTALNFILDKQNNLPLQYQSTENSFSFAPVIISTGSRCDVTTDTGMIDLTKAVKNAYNHTPFTRISDYSTLLSASSDYDFAQLGYLYIIPICIL